MAGVILNLLTRLNPEITNIDRWKCERVVPMELLCFGASRTGTSSMREALKMIGYDDVYHARCFYVENPRDADMWMDAIREKWDNNEVMENWGRAEWDKLLGHCMAVSDVPCLFFIPELMEAYPEAKVILTVRDSPEAWFASVEKTLIPMTRDFYRPNILRRIYRAFLPHFHFNDLNDEILRRGNADEFEEKGPVAYTDHNDYVRKRVKERLEKNPNAGGLLEFNVKEGWEPLCKFLGKEIPRDEKGDPVPFPRRNDAEHFNQTAAGTRKLMDIMVGFNMTITAVGLGALGYGAWLWRKRRH